MQTFRPTTRNKVRKGKKMGFSISHENSFKALLSLQALHKKNIEKLGGISKPVEVFEALSNAFEYGADYKTYIAKRNGEVAAGLLLFFFKDTVEYFCPAINESFRSDQPQVR